MRRFRWSVIWVSRRRRCIAWVDTRFRERPAAAEELARDARMLEAAGAAAIVLEGMPREVAAIITSQLHIPTIGIGAGPDCDGQILVFHDLVNLSFSRPAKFVRQYGDAAALFRSAIEGYVHDIEERSFPDESESYHLSKRQVTARAEGSSCCVDDAPDPQSLMRIVTTIAEARAAVRALRDAKRPAASVLFRRWAHCMRDTCHWCARRGRNAMRSSFPSL